MPRQKARVPPPSSDDDEWTSDVEGEQMELLLEVLQQVDSSHCLVGLRQGMRTAATLLHQHLDPQRFHELVDAWLGGAQPPAADCEPRQLARWRHRCSDAVNAVARAALMGRLGELEAGIKQGQEREAAVAAADRQLAASVQAWRQAGAEAEAEVERDEGTGLLGSLSAAAPMALAAAPDAMLQHVAPAPAAAAAGMPVAPVAAAAAAAVLSPAKPKRPAPAAVQGSFRRARSAGAGSGADQATAQPDKQQRTACLDNGVDAFQQQLQPPSLALKATPPGAAAGGAAAASPDQQHSSYTVLAPAAATHGGTARQHPGGANRDMPFDYPMVSTEAAAAAATEEQLTADLQAQGCAVLPPDGYQALSNSHRIFTTRMRMTCFLGPNHIDRKAEGVKAILDDMLFKYLDDQQAILLAYRNLEVFTHTGPPAAAAAGVVRRDQAFLYPKPPPLLTVDAAADLVTLDLTPGDIICGVVHKLTPHNITLVVLNVISVVIERAFIPDDWEFDLTGQCWVPAGDYTRAVSRGDQMTCMIMTYPKAEPCQREVLFNLDGSLLLRHTGLTAWQWPRQSRLRALRAAVHGQGEYGEQEEEQLRALQQEMQQRGVAKRSLGSLDGSDKEQQQQQQQQQQREHKHKKRNKQQQQPSQEQPQGQPEQQQQQHHHHHHHHASKEERKAAKEAAKAAKREEKQRLKEQHKAKKKAAKAAAKAEEKAARKADKAAAKAEKRAREQQQQSPAEQPAAKKRKQQQPHPNGADAAAGAHGHTAAAAAGIASRQQQQQQEPPQVKPSKKDKAKGGQQQAEGAAKDQKKKDKKAKSK